MSQEEISSQPPPEPQKATVPNWKMGVVLVSIGVAGGLIAGKYVYAPKMAPSPVIYASPVSTPDPTANWKTYTNTKYKYSLKYPEGYAAGQNGVNSNSPETVDFLSVYNAENPDKPRLAVSIWQKSQENNQEKMANDHYKKMSTYKLPTGFSLYPGMDNQVVKTISQETFLGYKSFSYTIKGNYIEDGAAEYITPIQNHIYIWFEYANNIFLVSLDDEMVMNQILSTFKFLEGSPTASPTSYSVPSNWKRFTTQQGLILCLPPQWESDTYGTLTFNRDAGYKPQITSIQSIPYSTGATREAYFKFWENEYPNVRQLVSITETNINGESALTISPVNSQESKTSPEGLTVVWYTTGKLWKAGLSSWSTINSSQTAFLKDFYTVISCSY